MRYCALICLLAALAFAADTSDPLEQSRRIDEQLQKLDESTPIAQEMKAISKKIDETHQQTQKQAEGLHEQMQKLRESEAWKAYEQKRRDLPAMAAGSAKMGENLDFHIAALRVVATPAEPRQDRVARMINSLLAANSSTHDAYVNLINRKCDLNLTARAPSADELKLAGEKGVKIELTPIAQDALVFIVHHKNPVRSLSAAQVRDIYDGKIKTWKELGGEDKPIRPLRRETNSGSRELFDALVMKGQQLPEPESAWASQFYANSMAGPFNRVTQDDAALGYTVYYYEHFMAASPYTRIIAIDGIEPSAGTIGSGKYPWISPVYAACRAGEPADSPAMKMLAWLTGPEGQAIVRESGYVPAKAVRP